MPPNLHQSTVLIIDNEPNIIQFVSNYLEQENINIMVARNGLDGLTRAKKGKPDLILLDIRMPGMNGFKVCHELKWDVSTKDIPVIFMTALTKPDDKLKAFALGGVDYVTKSSCFR